MGRVIVVGSINQDIAVEVARLPAPGETLVGRSVAYRLGGKGANQAAAAARAGASTFFVGAVGGDAAGQTLPNELGSHGVDSTYLLTDHDATTGVALITVAADGENTIVLDAGANGRLTPRALSPLRNLGEGDVVVLQGEVPTEVNDEAIRLATQAGARVVLNLAPAYALAPELLLHLHLLVVNESEAGLVLSAPAPRTPQHAALAARSLLRLGPQHVLITLGSAGAVLAGGPVDVHVPAFPVERVIDTTGAGDASVGVIAAALAAGYGMHSAVVAGMRAGAIAVSAPGAASSYTAITPL